MAIDSLQDILKALAVYQQELIVLGLVLLLFFVLWLLVRGIRLWYWRVDERRDELKAINENLQAIRDELKTNQILGDPLKAETMSETPADTAITKTSQAETEPVETVKEAPVETPRAQQDIPAMVFKPQSMTVLLQPGEIITGGREDGIIKEFLESAPLKNQAETIAKVTETVTEEARENTQPAGQQFGFEARESVQPAGQPFRFETRDCAMDKTGRLYTRQEIEDNIKE